VVALCLLLCASRALAAPQNPGPQSSPPYTDEDYDENTTPGGTKAWAWVRITVWLDDPANPIYQHDGRGEPGRDHPYIRWYRLDWEATEAGGTDTYVFDAITGEFVIDAHAMVINPFAP